MSDDLVKQSIAELQDLVRCRCHEAYTGRGRHDPNCECDSADAVKTVVERIEDLEAKLAKAVADMKALTDVSTLMQSSASHDRRKHNTIVTDSIWSQWSRQLKFVRTTLAELTGAST